MKNILNRGFGHLGLTDFITKVKLIISKLQGNAAFPAPLPAVVDVQAELNALGDAILIPDPVAAEPAIVAARAVLEKTLYELAENLEQTANMDPVPLATTGFDLHKPTTHTDAPPDTPQNVRLRLTGVTGQILVLIAACLRAKGYEVQTAPDPMNGPWTTADTFSSVRKMLLNGLPRAKDIWVRVRALGPNNTKSGWSDPATILVS
ncbi:MAG TPA: hypothetical protein VGG02_05735 [Chthoniobacterales bacterium]|jgi:hypothetical protein